MRSYISLVFLFVLACTPEGEVSDGELEIVEECLESELQTTEELRANFVGRWELDAFGCYDCDHLANPAGTIIVDQNGTGSIRVDYTDRRDSEFSFEWQVELEPRLRIHTIPLILEITHAWICPQYMVYSSLVTDGALFIYKKKD